MKSVICVFLGLFLQMSFAEEAIPVDEKTDELMIPSETRIPILQKKSGQFGVGAQAGFQSGLTVDYWTAESRALDLALTIEHGNPSVSLTHQWMFRGAFPGDADPLVPYVGAGILAVFGNKEDYLRHDGKSFVGAVQVPLGFEFLPESNRWTVFAEVVPGIQFTPVSVGFTGVDAGLRYYLN